MSSGDAVEILKAIMAGKEYPPEGVEDTPENRGIWDKTKAQVEDLPPGEIVDIPSDV